MERQNTVLSTVGGDEITLYGPIDRGRIHITFDDALQASDAMDGFIRDSYSISVGGNNPLDQSMTVLTAGQPTFTLNRVVMTSTTWGASLNGNTLESTFVFQGINGHSLNNLPLDPEEPLQKLDWSKLGF